MILVDTSSWIESLRKNGKPEVRARVAALMQAGIARLAPPVQLELWKGARGDAEKKSLRGLEFAVIGLPMDEKAWEIAFELAQKALQAGINVPSMDIQIAACAIRHGAGIESCDKLLDLLMGL